jgi:hypothetical protein
MQRHRFITAIVLALAASVQASACYVGADLVLDDVRYADVVVVGKISNYRIIEAEAVRESERFSGGRRPFSPYARFDVEVDEVLAGSPPGRFSVTWINSTFGEPSGLPAGPFLIALRKTSSPRLPLRGPSTTIFPNAEPDLLTVLQAPCAPAFLFETSSEEAKGVRRTLSAPKP